MLQLNSTKNLIWIDHHTSSLELMQGEEIKGFQNTKYAACELTFAYLYSGEKMPDIVRYSGLYDSMREADLPKGILKDKKDLLKFQLGSRLVINDLSDAMDMLKRSSEIDYDAILNEGDTLYQSQVILCKDLFLKDKEFTEIVFILNGKEIPFVVINQRRLNLSNFEINLLAEGYAGNLSFYHTGKAWSFSIYTESDEVDVSEIAKHFKGGGHPKASGFIVEDIEFFFQNKVVQISGEIQD